MNKLMKNDIDVADTISCSVFRATQHMNDECVAEQLIASMDDLSILLLASNEICMDKNGNFPFCVMFSDLGEDDAEYVKVSAVQDAILRKMARVQCGIEALLHRIDVCDEEWDAFVFQEVRNLLVEEHT